MVHNGQDKIKNIVLAYSGGLDTSIIIPWLKEHYSGCRVVAMTTDVGQGSDELDGLEEKAIKSGADKFYCVDVREEFVRDYIYPTLMAGAVYEGKYLLGTSMARPLQAYHQVEVAKKEGADAVAHGCTGKGNDQVRFELTYKALAPQLKVIAPWRIWNIHSREDAINYAQQKGIDLGKISRTNIYSRDRNIWHMSHEGGELEKNWSRPNEEMFTLSKSPEQAPDKETEITIEFDQGVPVAVDDKRLGPVELMLTLNEHAAKNAIGRCDVMETRLVGMKSRGVYETPGGSLLYTALRELEMLTLDRETLCYKQKLALEYAELVYNGKWFSSLRQGFDAFITSICRYVTGEVRLVLYKGNVMVSGRRSPYSLYLQELASFGTSDNYDQKDAGGFINLYGLSTGVTALVQRRIESHDGQADDIRALASFHDK